MRGLAFFLYDMQMKGEGAGIKRAMPPASPPSFHPHLQRLRAFNYVAPVVFLYSLYHLSAVLRETAVSGASMVKVRSRSSGSVDVEPCGGVRNSSETSCFLYGSQVGLPGLGVLASLTYLFGFFGIPAAVEGGAGMGDEGSDLAGQKAAAAAAAAAVPGKKSVPRPAAALCKAAAAGNVKAKSAGETVIIVGAGE